MLSDPYTPGVRDELSAAVKQFELSVTDAAHVLADTILALPDAPIAPSNGTELCAALYEFEAALKRILTGLRQAFAEGPYAPTPAAAKGTTAYPHPGDYAVRLAGVLCPHCSRKLRASDVDLDRHGGTLICRGCHADVARVERR
jgi:hypothetical protein